MLQLSVPAVVSEVVEDYAIVGNRSASRKSCLVLTRQSAHIGLESEGDQFCDHLGVTVDER